jgi:CheY-like chemotaxis protein
MGGEIRVDSALGQGSTFTIDLELPKGNPSTGSDAQQSKWSKMDQLKHKSILIAEDNAWNQKVLELLLDKMSAQYDIVSNGQEAIEALSRQEYDLVLMDVQMPVMDGYSASQKIRTELHDQTPIIALTASAQRGEREKCIRFGMNDYLSKPFTEEELKATIFKNISLDSNSTEEKPLRAMEQSEALYDLQSIRELADGDEDFIETMVEMFKEESGKMLDEMKSALAEANIDQVGKVAHKLKPTIDQFGISSLQEEVREIEKYDRQGSLEALKEKVDSFDKQLRAIASEMTV